MPRRLLYDILRTHAADQDVAGRPSTRDRREMNRYYDVKKTMHTRASSDATPGSSDGQVQKMKVQIQAKVQETKLSAHSLSRASVALGGRVQRADCGHRNFTPGRKMGNECSVPSSGKGNTVMSARTGATVTTNEGEVVGSAGSQPTRESRAASSGYGYSSARTGVTGTTHEGEAARSTGLRPTTGTPSRTSSRCAPVQQLSLTSESHDIASSVASRRPERHRLDVQQSQVRARSRGTVNRASAAKKEVIPLSPSQELYARGRGRSAASKRTQLTRQSHEEKGTWAASTVQSSCPYYTSFNEDSTQNSGPGSIAVVRNSTDYHSTEVDTTTCKIKGTVQASRNGADSRAENASGVCSSGTPPENGANESRITGSERLVGQMRGAPAAKRSSADASSLSAISAQNSRGANSGRIYAEQAACHRAAKLDMQRNAQKSKQGQGTEIWHAVKFEPPERTNIRTSYPLSKSKGMTEVFQDVAITRCAPEAEAIKERVKAPSKTTVAPNKFTLSMDSWLASVVEAKEGLEKNRWRNECASKEESSERLG